MHRLKYLIPLTLLILIAQAPGTVEAGRKAKKVKVKYDTREESRLNLIFRMQKGQETPSEFRGSFKNSKDKEITILEIKNKIPMLFRVFYRESLEIGKEFKTGKKEKDSVRRSVTEGKVYLIRRQKNKLVIRNKQGKEPSKAELKEIRKDFAEYTVEAFLFQQLKTVKLEKDAEIPALRDYFQKKLQLSQKQTISKITFTYKGKRKIAGRETLVIELRFKAIFAQNPNFEVFSNVVGEILIDSKNWLFRSLNMHGPIQMDLKHPERLPPDSKLSADGELELMINNIYY